MGKSCLLLPLNPIKKTKLSTCWKICPHPYLQSVVSVGSSSSTRLMLSSNIFINLLLSSFGKLGVTISE